MSKPKEGVIQVRDFSGGIETRFDSHTIPNNCVVYAKNVLFRPGSVQKRKGSRVFNSTSLGATDAIRGLFRLYRTDGTRALVAACGTSLQGTRRTDGSFTKIATSLQKDTWRFDAWKDMAFGASGINGLYQWSGTGDAVAVAGTPPKCRYVKQHNNYLFVAGDPSNPARLTWSKLDDHETWPAANFEDLSSKNGRGDWITGLGSVHGDLIIFMRRSTYLFVGDPTAYEVGEVFHDVGCVSADTIASDGGWTYFLAHDGLYRMQGTLNGMRLERLSDQVQSYINACPDVSSAAGCRRDHYYWLALRSPTSTTNDLVLIYDLQTKAWSRFEGLSANVFSVWDGPGDAGEIYFGSPTKGTITQGDFGDTDAGTAVSASVHTKFYDGEQPMMIKQFRRMSITERVRDNQWSVGWSVDQDQASGDLTPSLLADKDLTGTGETGTMKTRDRLDMSAGAGLPRDATGRSIAFSFSHSATTTAGDIMGFDVLWQPRRLSA